MKIVDFNPGMVKDAQTPRSKYLSFLFLSLKPIILFVLLGSLLRPGISIGQSANLDQIRNGALGVYTPTPAADWVNGNAGPSNAHFSEGYSVPYRMSVASLVGNSNTIHHLIIEWDTKHGNGHAIDYITHYQNLDNPQGSHLATFGHGSEVINPTLGTAFAGAPSLFAIPAPSSAGSEVAGQPTLSRNNLLGTSGNPNIHSMAIWGGTIVSLTYVFEDAQDATTGQTETRLDIGFRSTNGSTALLAWGGHIAAEYDWGVGRGATGVSGSPYHTRLISIDGSGGNQDRSLKSTTVIIPPPLCNISNAQFACPETPYLEFSSAGSSSGAGISYSWSLTNGSPSAGAKIDPTTATSATVKVVPIGSSFIAGGTFSLSLTVSRSTGQTTTCTKSPAGTIAKVLLSATASPVSIDLALSNTSQLGLTLAGSDDTNPAHYTFSWTQVPIGVGSLSANNISNPVYTATAAGSFTFQVTATQVAAPNCSDTATVTINVGASAPPCTVSGPSPICPSTTRTYVYDPTGDGVADPLPVNFNAQWVLQNNTNGASISGSSTGNSVNVSAGAECGTSFRIRITLTSTSGLVSSTCFKDVTVNDTQPPTITSCPADAVLECNASTDPTNTGTATATDNCSASVGYKDETTPGCYRKIKRTWTATDPCGNTATCVQTIILRDRTAPSIDCSGGGTPTVSDNCSATIDLYYRDNGSTRTWTATDESGNVATCTQNIAPPVSQVSAPPSAQQREVAASKTLVTKMNTIEAKDLEVKAFPNPFGTEVNFRFVSPKTGKAVLEVYDMMGRRVGIAYQGNLEANELKTIVYKVPASINSPIVYKLSVSDLSAHGKLMPSRK